MIFSLVIKQEQPQGCVVVVPSLCILDQLMPSLSEPEHVSKHGVFVKMLTVAWQVQTVA